MQEKEKFLKKEYNKKNIKIYYFIISFQQALIIFLIFSFYFYIQFYNNKNIFINKNIKYKLDYVNNKFAIMRRPCSVCGFFSYYKVFLSCIQKYIIQGFIPILEVETYPTVFNGYKANSSERNPWEYFFEQPFGYTLKNVIKKGKYIKYIDCKKEIVTPQYTNFDENRISIDFWHNIARRYIPIKSKIIKETNIIINKLFNGYNNILGILIRGTDYVAKRPRRHPIPPKPEIVINDTKILDKIYHYKWIFIATEDNIIRKKFINEFGNKLKYILYKNNIKYDYRKKKYLSFNDDIKGNIEFLKIYLINILILSKCDDIIMARTNGAVAVYILSEGFRYCKIYNLGLYP